MADCRDFYTRRDQRTLTYGAELPALTTPVAAVISPDVAETPVGRQLVLTLVEMLTRVHREVALVVPGASPRAWEDLAAHASRVAMEVDPCGKFRTADRLPEESVAVGIGQALPAGLVAYMGAERWTTRLSRTPSPLAESNATLLGGGLGICLLAAQAFMAAHGSDLPPPAALSLWNLGPNDGSASGPMDMSRLSEAGVIVGAGAVGAALCHWLDMIHTEGLWDVVDGDFVELSNTNRTLRTFPRHAGWPIGAAMNKAEAVVEDLDGFAAHDSWYDEWVDDDNPGDRLVVPVANERGVRQGVNLLGHPALVHATTASSRQAQLHRHIADVDQCISCRFPHTTDAVPTCSSAPPPGESTVGDAALPFLSAAAGIMLVAGLIMRETGALHERRANLWSLKFVRSELNGLFVPPDTSCAHLPPAAARLR